MNANSQCSDYKQFSSFLDKADLGYSDLVPLSADMGLRRYYRLRKDGKTSLLMDMSRAGVLETGLKAYVDVAEYLRNEGVRVPEIYHYDLETGFSIIEDLGNKSFGASLKQGEDPENVYRQATDVLVKIKNRAKDNKISLEGYKETLIYKRLGQFVDYYMSAALGHRTAQVDHEGFQAILSDIEDKLPPCPMGFCHADFHLENLMWLDNSKDPYAVIDFQDAFWGFKGYDLLNLLEDARVTVPDEIKTEMKARYCEGMTVQEQRDFEDWYVFMSCHFHLRVIGLFIKFAYENGGVEFLEHIPRLQNYIKEHLKHSIMAPLNKWLEDKKVSLDIPLEALKKKA